MRARVLGEAFLDEGGGGRGLRFSDFLWGSGGADVAASGAGFGAEV